MDYIRKIQQSYLKHFETILYITIFSIFLVDIKIYIPLFALNIFMVATLILTGDLKLKLKKWNILMLIFMAWAIINVVLAVVFFKHSVSYSNLVKLNLNLGFLISISIIVDKSDIKVSKNNLINFMEFMIIINFIQIILIYLFGGLFGPFFSGGLTESSDTAYAVSAYNNIIGAEGKNIWAGKFLFLYVIYLYIITNSKFKVSNLRAIIYTLLGILSLVLLLSRTVQLAVMIPIIFVFLYMIRNVNYKYRIAIYSIFIIGAIGALVVFFDKFFHIKFDMTDGGFTRIIMWRKAFQELGDTYWLSGNGLGYSEVFIETVVNRKESNLHNVYINTFYELGLVGIGVYIASLVEFLRDVVNKENILRIIFILVVPFGMVTFLQYLGFDNDIVMLFALILIVNKAKFGIEENNIK